ncbi:MAG: ribonuclease Y [Clostridiales bacterium]|nr:ribonuclease Y [Clostridiales bacterium]
MPWYGYLIAAAVAVLCFVIGLLLGYVYRKKSAEKAIGSAEDEAGRIVSEALAEAEQKSREAIVEAKDEIHRLRSENEKEMRDRRAEIKGQEKRLNQREESLEKRTENLERKEESLAAKHSAADKKLAEIEQLKQSQLDMLQKISGFSKEQAKVYIINSLQDELQHEKAVKIEQYRRELAADEDALAREVVATAIQHCAADRTAEVTVSVVELPNDEMKGRIIGREGRNIRSIEQITGVDLIVDDTPETITVSCFEPVRREKARLTLERLVADGRIHPARIEDVYKKACDEVEKTIRQAGERALLDVGVSNVSADLTRLLGSLKYRTSYGQNVLSHSIEVATLAGLMASEIGADVKLAKRAGLLHDIGKSLDRSMEGSHVQLGVEAARRAKESEAVVHAIEAHHGDVEAKSVVACLVQAADAISAARPGARRENVENYIKRLEQLEEIANSFDGVEKTYAIQAGRELRIIVRPESVNEDKMTILARDIAQKIEQDVEYPGQIKVNIIRETRVSEYAK